jgi:hypothetical protein
MHIILKCLGGLLGGIWTYKTLSIYIKRRKYKHIPGPKTRGISGYYFGNLTDLIEIINQGKIFSDKLVEWFYLFSNLNTNI